MAASSSSAGESFDDSVRLAAREADPDRYVAALLSPRVIRADLIVLAAFAGEMRRIPGLVQEPMMGEIRYQWWRDQFAPLERGEKTGNPLADGLGAVMRRHRLPTGLLIGVVDAAASDLGGELAADDGELASRHARGDGALLELAAVIHGVVRTTAVDEACAEGGLVLALARALSRVPWHLAHGGLPMTQARLAAHGLDPSSPLPSLADPRLRAALDGTAGLVERRLEDLSAKLTRLPSAAFQPLLPVAMVRPYLTAQRRMGSDATHRLAEPSPLARAWTLWRASRRRAL